MSLRMREFESPVAEGDHHAEGFIASLKLLQKWLGGELKEEKEEAKKKKTTKNFLVHGKAHYYDESTSAPIFENVVLAIEAKNEKEAERKFKEQIKGFEKTRSVDSQQTLTRIEIERITDSEKE